MTNPPKVSTKAIPPTADMQKAYEAERANLMRILMERKAQGDAGGEQWAYTALQTMERNHATAVQAGTFRDALNSFRAAQPMGWR